MKTPDQQTRGSSMDTLERLSNFNLIHYTGHYVLTIDRGMGGAIIYQGKSIAEVVQKYKDAYQSGQEE